MCKITIRLNEYEEKTQMQGAQHQFVDCDFFGKVWEGMICRLDISCVLYLIRILYTQ